MTDLKTSFDRWFKGEMKKNFLLSEPFIFASQNLLKYKFIALTSLFQKRSIIEAEREYHLSYTPADWNVNKSLDPWQIDISYSTDFKQQHFEKEIAGTERVIECYSCSGAGKNTCSNCGGKRELKCSTCYGSCQVKCGSCSGRGNITCNNCYGRAESKYNCTRCGGRGIISCANCQNGYLTCSGCSGRGMVRCKTCNGNGEIKCNKCNGKGRLIEYDILNAENFVSTEHFDLLEDGLKREHVNFFKPLAALEERFNLIDINRETINIEDIPQKILKIQPDKIKEIFQGHLAKSLEILKNHSCRKLEMVFGVVSIDELYKIAYTYGGKSFEVTFFKSEDCFYAPENPWEDFRKNVACEIEQHHKKGNKMATLQKINLYKKMNISTVRTEVIKEEILQSYAKRDVLILILPYLLSGIVLGLMFKVDKDGLVVVFILNIIPFAWIIYKRHKRRRDKIPPMRLYPRKIK